MQQFLQFIILTFIYSSTCFGHPHAHHQELNNFVAASGFTFVSWCCHHDTKVKLEVATAVVGLLMMGVRTPETC